TAAVADGTDEFRSRLDDSGTLALPADHEAVDVLEKDERQMVLVAGHNEPRGLLGGFHVQHAPELELIFRIFYPVMLAGHDAHRVTANARRSTHERLAELRLVFQERIAIHNAFENVAHLVITARIAGKEGIDVATGTSGRMRVAAREGRRSRGRIGRCEQRE